ncbi:MAG TPA: hypothetical protein VFB29_00325 [Pseudolabrys sp.]|nr:hypothetical protein [Pseudolabrys sp.]
MSDAIEKAVDAHKWKREQFEHYVEPQWCSQRLFDVESFDGTIQDPSCGFGRVVLAALSAGLPAFGTDIVDRGFPELRGVADFFKQTTRVANIVSNPPFDVFEQYALRALSLTSGKVALIWLLRRLPAARWLKHTPLARIYFLTPRPSMPPGHVITRGEKPGGGQQDFVWLVWDHKHEGSPSAHWLRRDK